MCWSTLEVPEKMTASEDVPIFKIMRKVNGLSGYFAYFRKFNYSPMSRYRLSTRYGELQSLKIEWKSSIFNNMIEYYINEGFHSYSKEECSALASEHVVKVINRSEGNQIQVYFMSDELRYVEGVIPKGSAYYKNSLGEYVSEEIILTKAMTSKSMMKWI